MALCEEHSATMREVWATVCFALLDIFGSGGSKGVAGWWKEKSHGLGVELHSSTVSSLTDGVTLFILGGPQFFI